VIFSSSLDSLSLIEHWAMLDCDVAAEGNMQTSFLKGCQKWRIKVVWL